MSLTARVLVTLLVVAAVIAGAVWIAPTLLSAVAPQAESGGQSGSGDDTLPDGLETATVVRVVDGDTLIVRRSGVPDDERLRMTGIDTPESVDPDSPVECFGPEASARTASALPVGSTVELEPDPTQGDADQYGRLLRYVWIVHADGTATLLNEDLVHEGFAEAFRDQHARWQQFTDAQDAAIADGLGLWAAC